MKKILCFCFAIVVLALAFGGSQMAQAQSATANSGADSRALSEAIGVGGNTTIINSNDSMGAPQLPNPVPLPTIPANALAYGDWKVVNTSAATRVITWESVQRMKFEPRGFWENWNEMFINRVHTSPRNPIPFKGDRLTRVNYNPYVIAYEGDIICGSTMVQGEYGWTTDAFEGLGLEDGALKTGGVRYVLLEMPLADGHTEGRSIMGGSSAAGTINITNAAGFGVGAQLGNNTVKTRPKKDIVIVWLNPGPPNSPPYDGALRPAPWNNLSKAPDATDLAIVLSQTLQVLDRLQNGSGVPAGEKPKEAAPAAVAPVTKDEPLPVLVVYFEKGSYVISPAEDKKIAIYADWLRRHPEKKIETVGQGCNLGSNELNINLGRLRSIVVKDRLVYHGGAPVKNQITWWVSAGKDNNPAGEEGDPNLRRVFVQEIGQNSLPK